MECFDVFNIGECSQYSSTSIPPSEPLSQEHRVWVLIFLELPLGLNVCEVPKRNSWLYDLILKYQNDFIDYEVV